MRNRTATHEEPNMNRRPAPAHVIEIQELRRSSAAGRHCDKRREASRKGCRANSLRRALREQG